MCGVCVRAVCEPWKRIRINLIKAALFICVCFYYFILDKRIKCGITGIDTTRTTMRDVFVCFLISHMIRRSRDTACAVCCTLCVCRCSAHLVGVFSFHFFFVCLSAVCTALPAAALPAACLLVCQLLSACLPLNCIVNTYWNLLFLYAINPCAQNTFRLTDGIWYVRRCVVHRIRNCAS